MLTIGYIHSDTVHEQWARCLLMTCLQDQGQRKAITGVLGVPTSILAHGRNALCQQFLASDDQWLLMVDTDMIFTLADVYALLDTDLPVVAGLYLSRHDNHPVWATGEHQQITDVPMTPVPLASAGTGFLLVHRDALEKVRADDPDEPWPWFGHDLILGTRAGEDVTFCHRLSRIGIPVHGLGSVQLGHIGSRILWPADHQMKEN